MTQHRSSVIAFCLLCCALLCAPSVWAASEPSGEKSAARLTLETSVKRIFEAIKNPDYVNPATRAPLRRQIEDEVLHIFDFREFSSRTVGPRWRTLTPDQQERFSEAFSELLLNTYLNKIDGYNGEQVTYTGEVADAKGNRELRTLLTMKDGKKIPVAYRMLSKNTTWLVYDVLIEGISLVKNYRTQFQSILNTSNPEELIAKVKEKAQEVR